MAKRDSGERRKKAKPAKASPPKSGRAAEKRVIDELRGAREDFLRRLGERLATVRDGAIDPGIVEGEREAQLDRLRRRIERRKAARDEILARVDGEIRHDEELLARLEKQGGAEAPKVRPKAAAKDEAAPAASKRKKTSKRKKAAPGTPAGHKH